MEERIEREKAAQNFTIQLIIVFFNHEEKVARLIEQKIKEP